MDVCELIMRIGQQRREMELRSFALQSAITSPRSSSSHACAIDRTSGALTFMRRDADDADAYCTETHAQKSCILGYADVLYPMTFSKPIPICLSPMAYRVPRLELMCAWASRLKIRFVAMMAWMYYRLTRIQERRSPEMSWSLIAEPWTLSLRSLLHCGCRL